MCIRDSYTIPYKRMFILVIPPLDGRRVPYPLTIYHDIIVCIVRIKTVRLTHLPDFTGAERQLRPVEIKSIIM